MPFFPDVFPRVFATFVVAFLLAAQVCLYAPQAFATESSEPSPGASQPAAATPENASAAGIRAFQKGDFPIAQSFFQEALKGDESNPILLYNLGLTELKNARPGLALAMWRKALAIRPDFSPASRAIAFQQARLEHSEIPHEVETWESFRQAALVTVSLDTYLLVSAVLLLVSGGLFLRFWGRQRRARLDESPLPAFPSVAIIMATLFVSSAFLSAAKAYDQSVTRGTIISKQVPVLSSPDTSATQLFDLYEGLEVIVRQFSNENGHDTNRTASKEATWVQVNYPGGSTGWIPRSAIMTTQDKAVL